MISALFSGRQYRVLLRLLAVFFCVLTPIAAEAEQDKRLSPIVIGTGGVTGNYFPVGGAICRLFNDRKVPEPSGRCVVLPSTGSIANLNALRAG